MSILEKLANHLVTEVPVSKLQPLLEQRIEDIPVTGGGLCGGGCAPTDGHINGVLCGFNCRPQLIAHPQGAVDLDGALGLSAEDLANVRSDLPKLRQAVTYQIETHLSALR